MSSEYKTYKLGDFKLQSGEIIPDAFIAYKTFGEPTSPAIIHPTWFSGCAFTHLRDLSLHLG
jgi:homoserine acetyltransferase